MPKTLAFLLIGLFFGTGFGFLAAVSSGAQLPGDDHGGSDAAHDDTAGDAGDGVHAGMNHATLAEAGMPAPAITLTLSEDGPQSRNLHIGVTDFTFDPQGVNGPHVPGRGHAHVYVNGVKIARTYSPWFHLSALPTGESEIRVTLNANDHSQLATDGVPIEATTRLIIE